MDSVSRRTVAETVIQADDADSKTVGSIGDCAMRNIEEKRAAFRKLHESGCFVIPNPWDVGTARMFQHLGFEAIASTSTGLAWSMGQPDYTLTREDVLHHLSLLSDTV